MTRQYEMNFILNRKIALPVPKVPQDKELMARASSPSSIYYIPESTFSKRPSLDIKVNNVSYTVNPSSLSWWQKLSTMQLPWEWMEGTEPQQVLDNVSFSINSGQMLAIMGNSGKNSYTSTFIIVREGSCFDAFPNTIIQQLTTLKTSLCGNMNY